MKKYRCEIELNLWIFNFIYPPPPPGGYDPDTCKYTYYSEHSVDSWLWNFPAMYMDSRSFLHSLQLHCEFFTCMHQKYCFDK